jgi:hypothetical protein
MDEGIEISRHPGGAALEVRTPGRFAMGIAIEILDFLDRQPGVSVKNTGWKQGFGLEVATWIPIRTRNLVAELQTDGDELHIRRASGSLGEFEVLLDLVLELLE